MVRKWKWSLLTDSKYSNSSQTIQTSVQPLLKLSQDSASNVESTPEPSGLSQTDAALMCQPLFLHFATAWHR